MPRCSFHVRVAEGGRIVIPAELRKAMSIREGDILTLETTDDGIVLTSPRAALRRFQEHWRSLPTYDPNRSVVDEFIAERRAEAARE